MRKTVLIADDHPVYLLGLRTLLQAHSERYEVLHEASTTDQLIDKLQQQPADIIITDFSMPGERYPDGRALIQHLRRQWPDSTVIVVTMITNPALLASLARLGVHAVLSKNSLSTELIAALKTSEMPTRTRAGKTAPSVKEALSPKESEVVRLLLRGMTVNEISNLVNRSKQTISTQKNSAMRKLGATSEFELYQYAQKIGLDS
ncbi:response regulator transcription factor [Enterobacteriaceae bacterium BIT-l23]|uniref:response regulator n=1 Tax=Jejubacter sp. L23 TaxID=3092086 RepID=UPI00158481AC|nr:response regulator transcription factor [Enterobacteriaceae bacterium BIT-l23]